MDNHASTSPLSFYRPDALPVAQPTASKHCWTDKPSNHKQQQQQYTTVDKTTESMYRWHHRCQTCSRKHWESRCPDASRSSQDSCVSGRMQTQQSPTEPGGLSSADTNSIRIQIIGSITSSATSELSTEWQNCQIITINSNDDNTLITVY